MSDRHLPAGQRPSMCASYSFLKCLIVDRTGLGAVLPRPHKLPARVVWQATNDSLFDFWQVPWQVAVYNQDRLVGVSELLVEDFKSLDAGDAKKSNQGYQ